MDIIVENLYKKFGEKVVFNNFSTFIRENQTNIIMGESGSGKTTLLKILMSLDKDYLGRILNLPQKVSAVFQENRLCENFTVYDNLAMICKGDCKNKIKDYLRRVDLETSYMQKVSELSGGMKRRVAILRALLIDYDLILMDEPFKGMDEGTKDKVCRFVASKIAGKTAIIVTHDASEKKYFNANIINIGKREFQLSKLFERVK